MNENLRFVPKDPTVLLMHIEDLKKKLEQTFEPKDRVSLLGEIGVYLRQLDSFKKAEAYLQQALELEKSSSGALKFCLATGIPP